jgi:ABC-type sugar transport system permease subunit
MPKKKPGSSPLEKEGVLGFLFLLPGLLLLSTIIFYPVFKGIMYSFTDASLLKSEGKFVGLSNYMKLLSDPLITLSLLNTLIYMIGTVGLGFILGLILALLLNERIRFRGIFRSIILCPWIIPSVVTAISWSFLYNAQYGAINDTLFSLGLIKNPINWLSPELAMLSIIITSAWATLPFHTIMLLAGLQSIPTHLYEASKVDGANKIQRFCYITLPGLKYVIAVDTVVQAIWAFKRVDLIYVMTHGGPVYATEVYSLHIYRTAFEIFDIGYASAQAVLMLLMLIGITIAYMRLLRVE